MSDNMDEPDALCDVCGKMLNDEHNFAECQDCGSIFCLDAHDPHTCGYEITVPAERLFIRSDRNGDPIWNTLMRDVQQEEREALLIRVAKILLWGGYEASLLASTIQKHLTDPTIYQFEGGALGVGDGDGQMFVTGNSASIDHLRNRLLGKGVSDV